MATDMTTKTGHVIIFRQDIFRILLKFSTLTIVFVQWHIANPRENVIIFE